MSTGEVVYPPGGRLGPRRQEDIELVLVHSGRARVTVDDGAELLVGAGSVALLLPGHRERFEFAREEPTHHAWVQGRPGSPEAVSRFVALPRVLPASTAVSELVGEAVAVARTPLSTRGELVAALAEAALWRYAGEAESRAGGRSGVVESARAVLHAQLADPSLDLERLAAAVHVSAPHLVRRFRAELGVTPIAYLWQRRIALGVDLLTGTGLPVGDVAARVGFRSVYHFSRRVRAATGMPPTELRRRRWAGASRPEGG